MPDKTELRFLGSRRIEMAARTINNNLQLPDLADQDGRKPLSYAASSIRADGTRQLLGSGWSIPIFKTTWVELPYHVLLVSVA
jgi:hypothetical protein